MAVDYRRNVEAAALALGVRECGMTRNDLVQYVWHLMRGEADLRALVDAVNDLFIRLTPGREGKKAARAQSLRMPG